MANKNLIEAQGISKVYPDGTVALRGVDLAIKPGEIHGLLGENGAGKTTLSKIISGLLSPTSGTLVWQGKRTRFSSPREALRAGIGMVHQHFALVGPFSGLENIALGKEGSGSLGRVRAVAIRKKLEEIMERSGLKAPLDVPVETLPVGVQQRIEILKMLYREVELLILDEPTSVLTPQEVEEFFGILRTLKAQGKGIVFITHKLREVMEIADRITVLRQGRVVGVEEAKQVTPKKLAGLMVGREVVALKERTPRPKGRPVLVVEGLTVPATRGKSAVEGISFTVHEGEILAIAGVQGNGQTELVEALVGVRPWRGKMELCGRSLAGLGPKQIASLGLAHIPEDRQRLGLILPFTVAENAILGQHYRFRNLFGLRWSKIYAYTLKLVRDFAIQTFGPKVAARSLSGGNQQRLVVGRELSKSPKVLVASQPTRGLDIAATRYIRDLLLQLRDEGIGILLISVDLDEIFELADRVAVMYEGRFIREAPIEELNREKIGLLMGGVILEESTR